MKIAINTIPLLSPLTGVGNYIYNIVLNLKLMDPVNDYSYFYGYFSKKLITYNDTKTYYRTKEIIKKAQVFLPMARKLRDNMGSFFFRNFDIYFEPNFIPVNIRSERLVVTVFDFSFRLFPEWHPKDRSAYFEKNFWKNIARADKIIVHSHFIKESAVNFGLAEDKLRTIYLGMNRELFRSRARDDMATIVRRYGLPRRFILFVGSVEPRKNLKNMIHAYESLENEIRQECKLVLAGFKGWENKEVMELLKQVRDDVVYVGYTSGSDLCGLYNLASLFIYPSFYEGFGLPPLEAMACGCPVVVSNTASLPEICGDAAYYVNPYSVESIADGMRHVLTIC